MTKPVNTYLYTSDDELPYPREFIIGQVDKIKFVDDTGFMEIFVETVSRTIVRDITVFTGYSMIGPISQEVAKAERIECDAHYRIKIDAAEYSQWLPYQPDVLYNVDGKLIKQYS